MTDSAQPLVEQRDSAEAPSSAEAPEATTASKDVEAVATDHDGSYHALFSHPAMVGSLLRTFVSEHFVGRLELESMERVNVKYQAPGLERRQGDVVWRIPLRDVTQQGASVYLLFLLEFQSSDERWMALRLLVYAGLLWQQLVEERTRLIGNRLPPIFAVVLHNGPSRWRSPRSLAELIALPPAAELWPWPTRCATEGSHLQREDRVLS